MTKRFHKPLAAVAAVSALALGGAGFANAQSSSSEPVGGPDRDKIQQGDQTTPDAPATKAAAQTTPEPAGNAPEKPGAESSEKPGVESESAPNSDGPGGHADEANGGNAAADHQAQGVE
jgi:hypothetical protein